MKNTLKFTEDLLKKCNLDLSNRQGNKIFISQHKQPCFEIGKTYYVKINKNIINNFDCALSINWNNNTAPTKEYYKIKIIKKVADKIYCECQVYNNNKMITENEFWTGYLPINQIQRC